MGSEIPRRVLGAPPPSPLTASLTGTAAGGGTDGAAPLAREEADPDDFAREKLDEFGYRPHDIDALRDAWRESQATLDERLAAIDPGLSPLQTRQQERDIKQEVMDELLEDLGNQDYDALLYALGESNRLGITWVPPGSPQQSYGLQMGDEVLSVGGIRFESSFDYLHWLRDEEQTGEPLPVQILRDGKLVVIDVPNGDIGRALKGVSGPPAR
jgi:predicted metalloprotease with PDZ domain